METYVFSYATFHIVDEDLAELIIHQDVELTEEVVNHLHNFLTTRLTAPFSILVNRKNAYSYDFEGQRLLFTIAEIQAVAFVVYNSIMKRSVEHLIQLPRAVAWQAKIFDKHSKALTWLRKQQKKLK